MSEEGTVACTLQVELLVVVMEGRPIIVGVGLRGRTRVVERIVWIVRWPAERRRRELNAMMVVFKD